MLSMNCRSWQGIEYPIMKITRPEHSVVENSVWRFWDELFGSGTFVIGHGICFETHNMYLDYNLGLGLGL